MYSFTIKSDGVLREIITFCAVSQSVREFSVNESLKPVPVNALWDTGSSGCCISKRLIDQLGLKSVGISMIDDTRGVMERNIYPICLYFPNTNWVLNNIEATDFDAPDDFDMLIGMEIITKGDFAISSENGNTVVSFAVPSQGPIDFEEVGFFV